MSHCWPPLPVFSSLALSPPQPSALPSTPTIQPHWSCMQKFNTPLNSCPNSHCPTSRASSSHLQRIECAGCSTQWNCVSEDNHESKSVPKHPGLHTLSLWCCSEHDRVTGMCVFRRHNQRYKCVALSVCSNISRLSKLCTKPGASRRPAAILYPP